jgi:hypothetical protein
MQIKSEISAAIARKYPEQVVLVTTRAPDHSFVSGRIAL